MAMADFRCSRVFRIALHRMQMRIVLFLCLLSSQAQARPIEDVQTDKHTVDTEFVRVETLEGKSVRHRRSASIFPPNLVFRFSMQAGNVTLTLQWSHQNGRPALFTIAPRGVSRSNHTLKEDFAVYQDQTRGSSVLVTSPATGDSRAASHYTLFGCFAFNKAVYQIEHRERYRRRRKREALDAGDIGDADHVVQRLLLPTGDFVGDAVLPPVGPFDSGAATEAASPYPQYRLHGNSSESPLIVLQKSRPADATAGDDLSGPQDNSDNRTKETRTEENADAKIVEYLVICDFRNFEKWKAMVADDNDDDDDDDALRDKAFEAMQAYYQFIVSGVDMRFRSIVADPPVKVVLSSILVSISPETSPWTEAHKLSATAVDDEAVLLSFARWREAAHGELPPHDHAGLFTGYDLATPSSTGTLGMAYVGYICHTTWGVSENEELFNAMVIHIAAHELGHSVGSSHDGRGNSCSSSSQYVMAGTVPYIQDPVGAGNPWQFSSCSQQAIATTIDTRGSCLNNIPRASSSSDDIPGLFYQADQQCAMTYGEGAVLCREDLYTDWSAVCYGMPCRLPGADTCTDRHLPFHGTPCGDHKWCERGQCVHSDSAPAVQDNCVFGDDPSAPCATLDCEDKIVREVTCCRTCNKEMTSQSPMTTSTVMTSTDQPSEPDQQITFELQTMIAIFIAAAVAV